MAKLKIEWAEKKTSKAGNEYFRASISDETGNRTDDVAIFSSFAQYAEVAPGVTVEGELEVKDYQGKKSYALVSPQASKPKTGGNGAIAKNMERKAESIATAQTRKENGIEFAATQRDATLIVTTFYPELATLEGDMKKVEIAKAIKGWRKWLAENFGDPADPTNQPPF